MSAEPDTILVRRDPVDGRPMSEIALDVVRTSPNPSRELDMAFSLLLQDAELKRLREKCAKQAANLADQQEALRRKNLALDALHYIWCDGGCAGGYHRFAAHDARVPLTEDVVAEAEHIAARLRRWFENKRLRDNRARMLQERAP